MKHASIEEFVNYIENLEVNSIHSAIDLVEAYYSDYLQTPDEQADEKNVAWMKYVVLSSKFCVTFALLLKEVLAEDTDE